MFPKVLLPTEITSIKENKFNPIALRKAKIVCNFGLSECNRVIKQHLNISQSSCGQV